MIAAASARTRPRAGLVPALLLLLAGLFAMHGLSGHGVESAAAAGAPGPMAAMAEPAAGMPGARPHPGMTMAGTCLAVLGGLVLVLSAARRTPVRIPVPVLLAVPASGRTGRDRDPPSLTELSVRRC